jgi:hypothetical protein
MGLTMPILMSFATIADNAILSGGSWLSGLPLTNLQQEYLSRAARSTDATAASTKLQVAFSGAQAVRLIGFGRHNLGFIATYRIKAGTTAGASNVYDSGSLNVWHASIVQSETVGYPATFTHDIGSQVTAQYWTIEFTDTTNIAGFVQLSRLWMGTTWTPTRNYAFGNSLGFEPRDVSEESLGGVLFHDRRTPRRVHRFALKALTPDEADGVLLDAQGRLGTAGQLWFVKDPTDTARGFKANGLFRFRRIDPIAQIFKPLHETSIELEEVL